MPDLLFFSGGAALPTCQFHNKIKEARGMKVHDISTAIERRQKGVTTVEYAVMLVLVAIAVLAFGTGIAQSVTNVFSNIASALK
jgi:Flp pilus assembly pilin Flp